MERQQTLLRHMYTVREASAMDTSHDLGYRAKGGWMRPSHASCSSASGEVGASCSIASSAVHSHGLLQHRLLK